MIVNDRKSVYPSHRAAVALAVGEVVCRNASGHWVKADANGTGLYPAKGVVTGACNQWGTPEVSEECEIGGYSGLTPLAPVYLSETAGEITQTAPGYAQVIGYAKTATIIAFRFQEVPGVAEIGARVAQNEDSIAGLALVQGQQNAAINVWADTFERGYAADQLQTAVDDASANYASDGKWRFVVCDASVPMDYTEADGVVVTSRNAMPTASASGIGRGAMDMPIEPVRVPYSVPMVAVRVDDNPKDWVTIDTTHVFQINGSDVTPIDYANHLGIPITFCLSGAWFTKTATLQSDGVTFKVDDVCPGGREPIHLSNVDDTDLSVETGYYLTEVNLELQTFKISTTGITGPALSAETIGGTPGTSQIAYREDSRLSPAEIQYLYNHGNSIANHSLSHYAEDAYTDRGMDALLDELLGWQRTLESLSVSGGSPIDDVGIRCRGFVRPGGWSGEAAMDSNANSDTQTARLMRQTHEWSQSYHGKASGLKRHYGQYDATPGTLLALLPNGPSASISIMVHGIGFGYQSGDSQNAPFYGVGYSATNNQAYTPTVMKAMLDAIAGWQSAGMVRCVTLDTYFAAVQGQSNDNGLQCGNVDLLPNITGSGPISVTSITAYSLVAGTPGTVTAADNHMVDHDPIVFTSLPTGSGLTTGQTYYVVNRDASTFQVESSIGGGALEITGAGGSCTIVPAAIIADGGGDYIQLASQQNVSVLVRGATVSPGRQYVLELDTKVINGAPMLAPSHYLKGGSDTTTTRTVDLFKGPTGNSVYWAVTASDFVDRSAGTDLDSVIQIPFTVHTWSAYFYVIYLKQTVADASFAMRNLKVIPV